MNGLIGGLLTNDYNVLGYSTQGLDTTSSATGTLGPIYFDVPNTSYANVQIQAIWSTAPTVTSPAVNSGGAIYETFNYTIINGVITGGGSGDVADANPAVAIPNLTLNNGVGNTPPSIVFNYEGSPRAGILITIKVIITTNATSLANVVIA